MRASVFRRWAALLLAGALFAVPAAAQEEKVLTVGDVSWVSGGTGEDSREHLKALERSVGFNLKATFVLQGGDYLSSVNVRIVGRGGKQLLAATTEGPMFLARLPAGSYDLFASVDGRELKQRVTITAGKPAATVFRWPAP